MPAYVPFRDVPKGAIFRFVGDDEGVRWEKYDSDGYFPKGGGGSWGYICCDPERLCRLLESLQLAERCEVTDTLGRVEALADAIMTEVWRLQTVGALPADVRSFEDLHDHCDANTLVDVAPFVEGLDQEYGRLIVNAAQGMVDARLRQGEAR